MIKIKIAISEKDRTTAKSLAHELFPNSQIEISKDDILLIAYLEKTPVGFTHIIPKMGKLILQGIGVQRAVQNKGIGSMLILTALELFTKTHLPVFLKVKSLNSAILLYEKFGFFVKDFREDVCTLKWQENN